MSHELSGARVEILREVVPSLQRIGFLFDPDNVGVELQLAATIGVAAAHGIGVTILAVRGAVDLERVFESADLDEVQAITIASDAMILSYRKETANLALRHRLLSVAPFRSYAEAGCLVAFGPSILRCTAARRPTSTGSSTARARLTFRSNSPRSSSSSST